MPWQKKKAWYLGNTTVRNAKRLRDGLAVLVDSPLHGNLAGRLNEHQFARLLDEAGVIELQRLHSDHDADASDMGRKWRAALMQLGFITPGEKVLEQLRRRERQFTVTPNGRRLLEASTLLEEQECFSRALLAHQIPSPVEGFIEPVFSPLRIVLEVIAALEKSGLDPRVSMDEMACFVQVLQSIADIEEAAHEIAQYRERLASLGSDRARKQHAGEYRAGVASGLQGQRASTLEDYADSNIRYLKLTGLFAEEGRRLGFAKHKHTVIRQILAEPWSPMVNPNDYVNALWNGAPLPTDDRQNSIAAIEATAGLLQQEGAACELPLDWRCQSTADISQLRLRLEGQWLKVIELRYAQQQSTEWQDIVRYLRALSSTARSGVIPQGEAPAYFEWAVWRAFLAVNMLKNTPWDARRFRVDQEMLPIGPAPGNGPDLVFEFEDFVLVVEVTLTRSSRQEAAEGESVRRHVAGLVDHYGALGKAVYGMFIANVVDTNTAETFRIGAWYRDDSSRMALRIVPITLTDFADLFETGFREHGAVSYRVIEELLLRCLADSNADAPEWKRLIGRHVACTVARLRTRTQ